MGKSKKPAHTLEQKRLIKAVVKGGDKFEFDRATLLKSYQQPLSKGGKRWTDLISPEGKRKDISTCTLPHWIEMKADVLAGKPARVQKLVNLSPEEAKKLSKADKRERREEQQQLTVPLGRWSRLLERAYQKKKSGVSSRTNPIHIRCQNHLKDFNKLIEKWENCPDSALIVNFKDTKVNVVAFMKHLIGHYNNLPKA